MTDTQEERRYREVFRQVHAEHPACLADEWLTSPCAFRDGTPTDRSIVWSRRNGPWRRVEVLWVGAAPGNAGGLGRGAMGAHGTRIPFGGDIAGGNLDVLLGSIGLDRNHTFIVAALNQLPERGGGEPRVSELRRPVGEALSSFHVLRATVLAAGPRLVACLGNVALRSLVAAGRLNQDTRLPGLPRLVSAGLERGRAIRWPEPFAPDSAFRQDWAEHWPGSALPYLLWLIHPSAQNMSPYAGKDTVFHSRMAGSVQALRTTMRDTLGRDVPVGRSTPPGSGIYALPEWRHAVKPRHAELSALWADKGI